MPKVGDWVKLSAEARKHGVKSKRSSPWLVANVDDWRVEVVKISVSNHAWIDTYHVSFLEVVEKETT